jgi:glucoamylase
LITLAAAEFLYDAVAQWKARHSLVVDETSLSFFKDLYPDVTVREYKSGNANSPFAQIMNAITAYADSFVAVVEKYTPADGSLSEQFNRDTGVPLSANDLTWSYASFVTMAERRAGQYPESWDTRKITPPPAVCAGTSTPGVYAPATAAGAPNQTVTCTVSINFNVNATTYFGENIYLIGNITDLGAWDINNAQPMNPGRYSSTRPLWYGDIPLPAGQVVSYQYVRQENCNRPYIYETINRTITVPACKAAGISTDEAWTGPVGTPGNC